MQVLYTDKPQKIKNQKGKQNNKTTKAPRMHNNNENQKKKKNNYELATSLQLCTIMSIGMPWNWGRNYTEEATANFSASFKASTLEASSSKQQEFLSFQIIHRTAGKELQIILPLTKLVPNFHTSKSPKMDRGRAWTQSYQLKNRIPNHLCNIAAQKKMVYGFLIRRHMGKH